MSRPTIIINDLDAERIDILLEQPAYAGLPIADALNAELDRAQMCSPEEMPHDVVTMNSRVKFRNLSDGEVRVRTLVYPAKMTDSNTQLSVDGSGGVPHAGVFALAIPFTGNFRAALQPTLKCWNSNTSQKLLATTCFNPICTSVYSRSPEDASASSFCSNINGLIILLFPADV